MDTTNGTGNAADTSPSGYHMRPGPNFATGPVIFQVGGVDQTGRTNYVADFDGADDRYILPTVGGGSPSSIIPRSNDFTLAVWAKSDVVPSGASDLNGIVGEWASTSTDGRLAILAQDENNGYGGRWAVFLSTQGANAFKKLYSPAIVQTNVWTHLALTRSGSTFTFYVDGVAATNTTDAGTRVFTGSYSYKVGDLNVVVTDDNYFWDGQIDSVRLYSNVCLSVTEVAALVQYSHPTNCMVVK